MDQFHCDICERNFTRKSSIVEHMKVHIAKREKLNCPECSKKGNIRMFSKRSNLVQHCRTSHPGCDLKNILQETVKTPIEKDSTENSFKCHICGNTYKRKAYLKTHISDIHEKTEKPKCEVCGTQFRNIGGLQRHVKTQKCNTLASIMLTRKRATKSAKAKLKRKSSSKKNMMSTEISTGFNDTASTDLSIDYFDGDDTILQENNIESVDHERGQHMDQQKDDQPIERMFKKNATHETVGTLSEPVASTSGVQQPTLGSIKTTKKNNTMTNRQKKVAKSQQKILIKDISNDTGDTSFYASRNEYFEQLGQEFVPIEENEYSNNRVLAMISNCLTVSRCSCKPEYGCGENCLNRLDYTECDQKTCPCGTNCKNSTISTKIGAPKCQRFMTLKKGWGVKACEPIQNGAFIMQYLGEVVRSSEYMERMRTCYRDHTNFYGMQLNADYVIDAHQMGNVSRFINHSCKSVWKSYFLTIHLLFVLIV